MENRIIVVKECGRQFVANSTHYVNDTTRQYIKRALCERLSLRGISRAFQTQSDLGDDFFKRDLAKQLLF